MREKASELRWMYQSNMSNNDEYSDKSNIGNNKNDSNNNGNIRIQKKGKEESHEWHQRY